MDKQALVSIIVPIYKVEKYLDECVQALVGQTYGNLEIILVDDGSPDNCPAMCDSWKARDGRIKVVHKANGGLPDARNAGIRIASGEWLLFIDSDDVVPVRFVEALVAACTDSNTLVASKIQRFTVSPPRDETVDVIPQSCGKDLISKRGGLYCCGALYSRELAQRIGLWFDTTLKNIEDVVWNGIYLRYVSEVVYVGVPYYYRMNPTSITSKCVDIKWQIRSWLAARRSLMNWFANKELTAAQKKEVKHVFRHCQNNIYAECVAGNIPYSDFRAMEKEAAFQFCDALVSVPEKIARNIFPGMYYGMYTILLRAKSFVSKMIN